MPKKSKKSKSKRTTLKQKHKIIKKVKQHHKKLAKKAKQDAKAGKVVPKRKDPGVPAAWPHKEDLAREVALHAKRAAEVADARRAARAAAREKGAAAEEPATPPPAPVLSPDASRRAFGGELARVLADADIVVQVLDARDPASCRCDALERAVARAPGPPKTLVFLLNKVDLVPPAAAAAWLAALRRDAPAVAFKAATGARGGGGAAVGRGAAGKRRRGAAAAAPSAAADVDDADGRPLAGAATCVGADALLKLLRSLARARGGAGAVVGVVGLPNVGKSSVINSLKRARVARTGDAPGVTRAAQVVKLDAALTLLDSPGVVLAAGAAAADLALRGCAKVDGADAASLAAAALARLPPRSLAAHYRVPPTDDPDELLRSIAAARGRLGKGGVADVDAAAKVLATDWRAGRIKYYTLPPAPAAPAAGDDAAIVAPAAGVDLASIYSDGDAKALADTRATVLPPTAAAGAAAAAPAAAPRYFLAEPAGAPPEDASVVVVPKQKQKGDDSSDDDDESASDDDDDAPAPAPSAARQRAATTAAAANAVLYSAEGQFNPVAARAAKKAAKKAKKARAGAAAADALAAELTVGGGDDAYDFREAFGDEDGGASSGNDDEMGGE